VDRQIRSKLSKSRIGTFELDQYPPSRPGRYRPVTITQTGHSHLQEAAIWRRFDLVLIQSLFRFSRYTPVSGAAGVVTVISVSVTSIA
jgi:hypothetical protein